MNLEHLQIALFAAYDIRNAMSPKDKDRPTENDTCGESIDEVIDFLVELEQEMSA